MTKALIVEDDPGIAGDLAKLLTLNGWMVEQAHTGADGLQLILQFTYDLLLLDWCLPDLTGLEICKRYRGSGGTVPIIFITGQSDIEYKESGLDAGSDDYITKPFDERELMARIRNVMRRPRAIVKVDEFQLGSLVFDGRKRTVSDGGKVVLLTAMEYNLVEFLLRHKGESFTSAQPFGAVWQSDSESTEETVRVHIRVLRRKFEIAGLPPVIQHRRGFGYSIEAPV